MKVVRGMDEGRQALSRDSDDHSTPQEVLEGIKRIFGEDLTPEGAVGRIVSDVAQRGDEAVREYTKRIDGVELEDMELDRDTVTRIAETAPQETREALRRSVSRIRDFHVAGLPRSWVDMERGFGEIMSPMERVGLYIPGGLASYPSTVMMTAIPAKVAGVKEIVLATPPQGERGPNPAVMAAALICGVNRVFQVGGAQAIAALAYGTESIPRVDMVCGPGNIFVTLAKKLVYGQAKIDGLEGPTETLIVADDTATPALCAADLLGQAEHDLLATPVLITTSESLIPLILEELKQQMESLSRNEIISASIEARGAIILVDSLDDALELANYYAPEHLCLMVREPWRCLDRVHNAGGVFLGDYSPEVMGDYVAGPSHVMPTGGTARFHSYLGASEFLRRMPVVDLDPQTSLRLAKTAATIARTEGFDAHARAVEIRAELQNRTP